MTSRRRRSAAPRRSWPPRTTRTTTGTEQPGPPGEATHPAPPPTSTVAEPPPWETAERPRPTWGLAEGEAIAEGRTILRRLGGGKRYEVFLVWDEHRLAVLVAKVLRPDQAADPRALHDLRAEGGVLERLAHPVVMRGFATVGDGPFPHLLLEHLEGPTLQSLLERHGPLGLEQLLPLGLHVASALHYCAREDVLHLDVKPENLVMGAPPRLIDFSVARTAAEAARLRKPIGTDAYMAPEQCDPSRAPIGPAADVFGLGATLQHALTGERAFPRALGAARSSDPGERFPQLVRGPAALPRRTPAPLAELLEAMLDREPADRPTAAEVAGALEPVVAELPRRLVLSRRGWRRRV